MDRTSLYDIRGSLIIALRALASIHHLPVEAVRLFISNCYKSVTRLSPGFSIETILSEFSKIYILSTDCYIKCFAE